MSDLTVFFKPVSENLISESANAFSTKIDIHTEDSFPELEKARVAILGVKEDRNSTDNKGCRNAPDQIRKYLYQLFYFDDDITVADLGNIEPGETPDDTYFAVKTSCAELIKKGVIPIIIGGSQDITYANYAAYEDLEQTINLVSIDSTLDIGDNEEDLHSANYMSKIILHQPNYLFNYGNIGHQRYLVNKDTIDLMQKLHFEMLRLGDLTSNAQRSEPLLRNADLISFDISSIRWSDAPGSAKAGPNGLYAEEACQISKYAGLSDKLTSIGFYEYNPEFDSSGTTSHLIAQMIWCFIDGVLQRKNDYPLGSKETYTKYIVDLSDSEHQITFYKSDKSDRWWMDVPYPAGMKNKYERHHLVPCTYEDYVSATNEELPDKWWQTYQKLV